MDKETIVIDKNYKGLKRIENGDYVFDGDLVINGKEIEMSKESYEALKQSLVGTK